MVKASNNFWLSVHLFYTKFDFLLINGIKPFIDDLKRQKKIESYFFIRYWENGPHIRLRLKISLHNKERIKTEINDYFSEFFITYPSERSYNPANNFPNNSVQYIEYIPEIDRYGGEYAILEAEKHFEQSSNAVLELMAEGSWSFNIAQAKVLQLHILFLEAINISQQNKNLMLDRMAKSPWRNRAQKIVGEIDMIDNVLERQYNKNKNALKNMFLQLKELTNSENEMINYPILNQFYKDIKKTDQKLNELARSKKIEFTVSDSELQRINLYPSYLHMLNNRMGLKNHDEIYMSFIMVHLYD